MKKSEVFQILYSTLDVFLKPHGFKLAKGRYGFIRHFKGGFHVIHLLVTDYQPEYQMTFTFGIRIDEVEKIANPFSSLSLDGYRDSMTFHSSWGGIQGDNLFNRTGIYTEADVMDTALEIISFLRDVVLPYFEKYTDIKAMDAELNDNPLREENERFKAYYLYHTAIILAKLVSRSDFDALVEIYRKHMEAGSGDIIREVLPKFNELVEYLRTLDTTQLLEKKSKKSARTAKA